ncbi:hypothetical protein HCG46_26065 [Labrenzia sp. PO1]|uniref:hypothetical protein n=1 Tax=Labrenzia sp. PO1 TaxID=2720390 RepID=UPI001444A4B0|nr:hypothetical protein [Labrenzia sp. PO1]NKI61767.1 hypothetical protein [Labrenzia sp. PO1]
MQQDFNTHTPTITNVIGFEASTETDHTEMNMAKIVGAVAYDVIWPNGHTETLYTGLRPGDNFGWTIKVIEAVQAWRNAGGVIPEWVPPTPEELREKMPSLTARQFRLGLLQSGRSLSQVETAIAAIADPTEREKAQVEWEYAAEFNRMHPLVVSLSVTLGFTPEDVDTLWQSSLQL